MTVQEFSPQQGASAPSDRPQGTLEELRMLKMDPTQWGSCAPHGTGQKGCPIYPDCPIPKFRDGFKVGKVEKHGPALIGVGVILSRADGSAGGGQIMPCWDWFYRRLKARRENAKKSGEVVRILGVEGDDVTVSEMTTTKAHKTRAEGMALNCEGCAKGDCMLRKNVIVKTNLKDIHFPRPAERFPGLTLGNVMAEEMLAEMERDTDSAMLRAHVEQKQEIESARLTKE